MRRATRATRTRALRTLAQVAGAVVVACQLSDDPRVRAVATIIGAVAAAFGMNLEPKVVSAGNIDEPEPVEEEPS